MTASIERLSPLAAWQDRFAQASAAPASFTIRELPFTSQVDLRGDPADAAFMEGVRRVLGCELPVAANTFKSGSRGTALWLGPDEWLVVDGPDRADAIASQLRQALAGRRFAVTDVSAARTVIEIAGGHARLVLAKGCPLDLHATAFEPGRTGQTLLAKARVLMQCVDVAPAFRLFVLDSFAPYLAEWLIDAAAECAAARALGIDDVAARFA